MVQPICCTINFHMNTSGRGPFAVVSTSLLADGIKSHIQTRSAALGRRSARHHQDLGGEIGASANQADKGRWRNRAAGHRTTGHSTRTKKLGGRAAHLKEQNQGRSRDEPRSGGAGNESSRRAAAAVGMNHRTGQRRHRPDLKFHGQLRVGRERMRPVMPQPQICPPRSGGPKHV
jgi:hypothetical protein